MVADAPWDITHPRRPVLPPLPMTAIMDEYVHSGAVRPVAKVKVSSPTFHADAFMSRQGSAPQWLSPTAPQASRLSRPGASWAVCGNGFAIIARSTPSCRIGPLVEAVGDAISNTRPAQSPPCSLLLVWNSGLV